ncbi:MULTISPECIES: surface carbohydrate biosynthesis protein [unclassified Marinobacter]|uniref:surface carbohydrate biosynthesis protein n=1 Tax=unclassified Marinobacter TaxID=83889 RepID=UPI001D11F8D5|nr:MULTISPECIES: surface carbohydrate biosynthesis protein [unclassified Marinobacter]
MKVLIVYERKNRELETALFLQKKFQKAGFECNVVQFYWGFGFNLLSAGPDILVVPHLYNGLSVARLIARYGRPRFILNLQYEQVLSDKWERLGHHNPSGTAMNAVHICWGRTTFDRLRDFGVPSENLLTIGAPHLDLLSGVDEGYCAEQKRKLAKAFGIEKGQDWSLFLSSFTYADISEHRLRMNESVAGSNLEDFVEIHSKSRNEVLTWLEQALNKNPSSILIYRPHPDELNLDKVYELANKYNNFRVISFGSAKQWIMAADTILSWYSTTVVESHYLKKHYQILRPFDLPDYFDSVLLKRAKFLTSKDQFLEYLRSSPEAQDLPLRNEDVAGYYENIDGSIASERLVNYAEQMLMNQACQDFSVSNKHLFRAKVISFSVLSVFILYRLTKKFPLVDFVRKIPFFDRWFSEFDNQFAESSEIKKIRESLDEFDTSGSIQR